MYTRLLALAVALCAGCLVAPASADAAKKEIEMFPGAFANSEPGAGYMGLVIGRIGTESRSDNLRSTGSRTSGWTYGLTMRGESLFFDTGYGGSVGAALDLDVFLVSPGAIEGPQEPSFSYLYMGISPALALGVFKTKSVDLTLELGAPLNTDFYGLSAGFYSHLGYVYLGYRMRTGTGWAGQEFLDERIRIGLSGRSFRTEMTTFLGLEVIDGYGEDVQGRANLASLMRGSYTMASLIVSMGK